MKTANETPVNYSIETPTTNFSYRWNATSDGASLKAWEEENEEYATWDILEVVTKHKTHQLTKKLR